MGFYWIEEYIDLSFVISRFSNPNGNLYKGLNDAWLTVLGDGSPEAYENATGQYKQESGNGNWTDLADFIMFLNISTPSEFSDTIEQRFNVENFLRITTIEVITGESDGYTTSGHNYFIYFPPDAPAEFVRHDFGSQKFQFDFPINNYGNPQAILHTRIFQIPRFVDRFYNLVAIYLAEVFNPWSPLMDRARILGQYISFETSASDPGQDLIKITPDIIDPFAPSYAQMWLDFIPQRYENVKKQLADLLPQVPSKLLNIN